MKKQILKGNTVKYGYNEHAFNENLSVTNGSSVPSIFSSSFLYWL